MITPSKQAHRYIERAVVSFNNPFFNTRKTIRRYSDSTSTLSFYSNGKYQLPENAIFQQVRILHKNTLLPFDTQFSKIRNNLKIQNFIRRDSSIIENATISLTSQDIQKFFKIKNFKFNDDYKKKKIKFLTKLYQLSLINSLFCDDIGLSINRINIFEEDDNLCFYRVIPINNQNFMKLYIEKTTIKFLENKFKHHQKKFNNFLEYKNKIKQVLEQYNGGIFGIESYYINEFGTGSQRTFQRIKKNESNCFMLTTETSEVSFTIFYPNYRKDKNEFIPNWKEIQKMEDYLSTININLEKIVVQNWKNYISNLSSLRPTFPIYTNGGIQSRTTPHFSPIL